MVDGAVGAYEARTTRARILIIVHAPACCMVLTGHRRTRIKARAVYTIVTVVAQTLVRGIRCVPTGGAVVARVTRARIKVMAGSAKVAVQTSALESRGRSIPAGGAVIARRHEARVEMLTDVSIVAIGTSTCDRPGFVRCASTAILTLQFPLSTLQRTGADTAVRVVLAGTWHMVINCNDTQLTDSSGRTLNHTC